MPNMRVNMDVTQKGTLFNLGARTSAVNRAVVQINDKLAQEAVNRIHQRLGMVLKHPTGFYQSQIMIDRRETYRGVTDNNVVYGGWLEGVSSRNRTTRFKGYHTFRIVRQSMNRDKATLAGPIVIKLRKDLNR